MGQPKVDPSSDEDSKKKSEIAHTWATVMGTFVIKTPVMTHKHFSCDSDSRGKRVSFSNGAVFTNSGG